MKRRQKLHELFNKEFALLDQISLKIEEDRELRCKQLKDEIEEVRRLKEIECKELAEAGYRKRTTMNRDNYRLVLNKLYVRDLNAQIELNKQIKTHENRKEERMPVMVSLPLGFGCGSDNTKPKRDLNEELSNVMSAREARKSEIAKQKKKEAEETAEREEMHRREIAQAAKAAYERKAALRSSFERWIEERNQELESAREEDARTSAWLTSNAIQQGAAIENKSLQDKATYKQRALAFFEYAKQLQRVKLLEEERRELAMERTAGDIMKANEAKQRRMKEASQALEIKIRQAQLKQIQEKEERSFAPTTDDGPSFLDKMLGDGERGVDGKIIVRQEGSRNHQQQVYQKSAKSLFTDREMEDCEFTRPFQRFPERNLGTYEYLHPWRKQSFK
ncbi:unnamed protein product [Hydatigera taeniaeformis]|uniref:TPH domain-containing protein n=1 Tax=Hydatigena taeniaeformis TaxID=6205 RepID=A0A0R3X4Y1_HYDTA|nr:unnamed protein product [Hydatigera taeniaeformis]